MVHGQSFLVAGFLFLCLMLSRKKTSVFTQKDCKLVVMFYFSITPLHLLTRSLFSPLEYEPIRQRRALNEHKEKVSDRACFDGTMEWHVQHKVERRPELCIERGVLSFSALKAWLQVAAYYEHRRGRNDDRV